MKKLFVLSFIMLLATGSYALGFVITARYKPQTTEEMLLPFLLYSQSAGRIAQVQAQREQAAQQRYEKYSDKAYECYKRADYNGFIYYSAVALETGYYDPAMYYDRGVAFEVLHDYKHAKQEYKYAAAKGYEQAATALQALPAHKKAWIQSQSR